MKRKLPLISLILLAVLPVTAQTTQRFMITEHCGSRVLNPNCRIGYVDENGTVVIRPKFGLHSRQFSDGLALVTLPNSGAGVGYINRAGRWAIHPLPFDDTGDFSEGLASAKLRDKYGYIDRRGRLVIRPCFDWAFGFAQGFAAVEVNGKWGYIDRTGRQVIAPSYDNPDHFHEGGMFHVSIGDKHGFIDAHGRTVISLRFDDAHGFSDGLAIVKVGNLWGVIDRKGQIVVMPQFSWMSDFSDGVACFQFNDTFGYVDRSGKRVFGAYPEATGFMNGLLPCKSTANMDSSMQRAFWSFLLASTRLICFMDHSHTQSKMVSVDILIARVNTFGANPLSAATQQQLLYRSARNEFDHNRRGSSRAR